MIINNYYKINSKNINYDISSDILKRYGKNIPIIVCLGTNRVLSDMVGVFVADYLKARKIPTYIFGGTKFEVNKSAIKYIANKFKTKNILIVDSGLLYQKNAILFSNYTILNNGEVLNIPCICCNTIFVENKKINLSKVKYAQIIKYAKIVSNSICDYFSYVKLINTKFA